jgi:diaminopimelate decarboxylase
MNTAPEFVISRKQAEEVSDMVGTPAFVYDERTLRENAKAVSNFPNAFGLTARYAMKANPHSTVLRIFDQMGLHFDASTVYEAQRAALAGINPEKIQLTSQVIHEEKILEDLVSQGMLFNATSLHQLEIANRVVSNREISIRINPGEGSGAFKTLTTGGPESSFGIWHEDILEAKAMVDSYGLKVVGLHTHIGSGADPEVGKVIARKSLHFANDFPEATKFNLGGGFKRGRVPGEKTTDLQEYGMAIATEFRNFYGETGREFHLEIEPGTYLVANTGSLLTRVMDVKKTTEDQNFLLVDAGMNEVLRIPLYGAQHRLTVIPQDSEPREERDYIVCGPCCESTDVLTIKAKSPDTPEARRLTEARIGDLFEIGSCGAYCESMGTKGYNAIPEPPIALIGLDDKVHQISSRGTLSQLLQNEIVPEGY